MLTSAVTGESIPELYELLQGKMCVLAGQSGVGKNSILNTLNPVFSVQVREVRKGDNKGRHTTTGSKAYRAGPGHAYNRYSRHSSDRIN